MGTTGAVEEVERPQRRRNLVIGIAVVVALVLLAFLTRSGGEGPGQRLSAGGSSTTARAGAITRPGAGSGGASGSANAPGATNGAPGAVGTPTDPAAAGAGAGAGGAGTPSAAGANPGAAGATPTNPSANSATTTPGASGAVSGQTGGRASGASGGTGVGGGIDGGSDSGSTATTSGTTTPTTVTTTTVPAAVNQLTITETDVGKTFSLTKGGTLTVQLGGGPAWSVPASDAPALTRTSNTAFSAAAVGTAHVTATATPACRNTVPQCATPDFQFSVTVNVVN